jgi:hypothetical protein
MYVRDWDVVVEKRKVTWEILEDIIHFGAKALKENHM